MNYFKGTCIIRYWGTLFVRRRWWFDVTQDTRIDSALFDLDSLFFEPICLSSGINEFYSASIDRSR